MEVSTKGPWTFGGGTGTSWGVNAARACSLGEVEDCERRAEGFRTTTKGRGGQLTSADMATSSASCSVCGGVGLEKREMGEGRRERKSRTRPDEAEAEEDARQRARRVPALDPNPHPRPALSPQEWTGLA